MAIRLRSVSDLIEKGSNKAVRRTVEAVIAAPVDSIEFACNQTTHPGRLQLTRDTEKCQIAVRRDIRAIAPIHPAMRSNKYNPRSNLPRWANCSNQCSGFTIAEVLGALLILAVSIIGIVALHLEGQRAATLRDPHARARTLATEMAKRVRLDKDRRVRYETAIGIACRPGKTFRRAADAALNEVACWEDKVESELPNGVGTISHDSSVAPTAAVITVSWSQSGAANASYVVRVAEE